MIKYALSCNTVDRLFAAHAPLQQSLSLDLIITLLNVDETTRISKQMRFDFN